MSAINVDMTEGLQRKDIVQDIAGEFISIEDSDEVCTQIVGKTKLLTRPRGIGIRLYWRTLSLYIVLRPVCRRLEYKYARGEGALSLFLHINTSFARIVLNGK